MPGSQPNEGTAYDFSPPSSQRSHHRSHHQRHHQQHHRNGGGDRTAIAAIGRTRSGHRMWSDPAPSPSQRTQLAIELLRPKPVAAAVAAAVLGSNSSSNSSTTQRLQKDPASSRNVTIPPTPPMTAALNRNRREDIPLRPLPSTLMAHYRNNQANVVRTRDNLISSIHDEDLYEDEDGPLNVFGSSLNTMMMHTTPRAMRQAPKLLTLDDYNLISLGYKPVMTRRLPWISLTGMAATASNAFCGIIALYGLALTNGGPAWTTWSFLIVGLFSIVVSMCLSELASAYPTTAGAHHWVYQLGSARRRAYLSWMVGWFTIVSAVATTASIAFFFSSILGQLLQTIHKVVMTPATQVMFHLSVLMLWQLFNLLPIRALGLFSTLTGVFAVGLLVALVSVMLSFVGVDPLTNGHIPFTTFLNYSGSSSAVYAMISSSLMASFVFCPQDTVIRMSEETRRPERTIPRLLIGASISNVLFGFPLIVALNYAIAKPMKGLLDETVPGVRVLLETLTANTGVIFLSMVLVAICFTGVNRLAMASRTVYAFARDGGVAHSSYWNHLHPRRKTPQRVSWLVTASCMCCIFPFFWGNAIAFQWIASLGCIASNICFAIPLWMRLTTEGQLHFIVGNFSLGRFSRVLHVIAIFWLILLSLALMLPSTLPLTKNNFNYAPVVLLLLLGLFAISWFKARTDFTGSAKNVSRASHQLPTRPLPDIYPRKVGGRATYAPLQPLSTTLMGASTAPPAVMFKRHAPASTPSLTVTPPMASFRQPPAPGITTKFKDPSAPSSLTAYLKKGAAANRIFPEVTDRRGPTSLNPPRRDPAPKKNQQQQQGEGGQDLHQQEPSTASSASVRPTQSTEQPQQQQQQQHNQHQQGQSNLTMTTIGSNQSHPTSILGLPFSDSPEMLPRELPAAKPQPATTATASSSEGSGHASSGLLLTKSLSVSKHQVNSAVAAVVAAGSPTIPEIAVAPATSSTVETSSQEDKQPRFMTKPQNEVIATRSRMPPLITFDQPSSGSGIPIAYQSSLSTEAPKFKPSQQGIESFYQLGNLASTSNNFQQRPDDLLMRSSRERAPTPYPQSLMSMEESGLSEDARSMLDLDQVVHSTGISSPPLYVATGLHNHQLHLQNPYMLNQQQLSISQFPTLDGYPLIKSPSTIRMSTSGGGESGLDVNSGGGGSEGTGRHDHPQESSHSTGLALPTMLPLSRTPTIQNSENEYGASFHMESDEEGSEGDEDVKEEKEEDEDVEALYKTIGEADDSYIQEYHHSYPLFSLNTPLPKSNMPGFFGLPNNREISGTTISKSLPSRPPPITTSLERPKPKEPSSTQRPEQPSSRTIMEQQDFLTLDRREDPIERVLLSASPDPELYQRQQQLQRSRSVASWAREQARIQVKRNKKRAVAMKAKTKTARQTRIAAAAAAGRIPEEDEYEDVEGEEKEDEAEESETYSSSDFSSLSDISSSTQGSSSSPITPLPPSLIEPVVAVLAVEVQQEKPQQPLRRDSGPIRVRGQGVVKRDGPIEYMVPEENEEEEEQQGFYMDTDDVLSPSSFERESIGAGVGRP